MSKQIILLGIIVFSLFLIQGEFFLSTSAEPLFSLYDPGSEFPVDYNNYGTFAGINTTNYSYTITDVQGLSSAVGEGIYPNTNSIYQDPEYQRYLSEGRLVGSHWDFVNSDDPQADFYKWATAPEAEGVRLLFMAQASINAGLIEHAIKAYYAIVVHFPETPCWDSYGGFYWYVGPAAIDMINTLCRDYAELELKLVNGRVQVENGDDLDLGNDIFTVTPGSFVAYTQQDRIGEILDLNQLEIVQTRGTGEVQLVQYSNGHWQVKVQGNPYIIRGLTYSPTKTGMGPDDQFAWQFLDENGNGKIDAPYDAWVDKNGNNQQDTDELTVGDFQLLKEMGCNTIRLFHTAGPDNITYVPEEYNKELLRDMYETYGIRVIMGDFLGAYTVGSGATWEEGTDYTDPQQRENMKNVVRQMVLDHKDEPYVLLWLLGNENNMAPDYTGINAARTNAATYPQEYAEFLNEVTTMIHELDPDHPVAVGNLGLGLAEYYAQYAPELDILGTNWYPTRYGVGISYLLEVREKFDRPIFFPEYGADAYHYEQGVNEEEQAEYHEGCWKGIVYNSAGNPGEGNVIGGVLFEWLDEWWKDHLSGDSCFNHQTEPQFFWGILPDNWSHEEWYGVCGQGNGSKSPFLRELRLSYYSYKKMWAAPIRRDSSSGDLTLSWSSFPGIDYDIYYSDDSINWFLARGNVPASGLSHNSWTDDGTYTGSHPDNVLIRYYRVAINGSTPPLYVLTVNSGGTLSGQVLLQGRNDHSNLITFELRNPEETTPIAIYQITTTTDGTYTLDDIPTATYDLTAKTSNSLRAKQTNIIVKTGQVTPNVNFNLLSGDANNDNSVGTGDMLILKSAWLSNQGDENWDERADFNGDGSIGTGDMIIMKNNWLVSGDELENTKSGILVTNSSLNTHRYQSHLSQTPPEINSETITQDLQSNTGSSSPTLIPPATNTNAKTLNIQKNENNTNIPTAPTQVSKNKKDNKRAMPLKHAPNEIIVKFRPSTFKSQIATLNSKVGVRTLKVMPKVNIHRLKSTKGMSTKELLELYRKNPNVEYVEPNYVINIDANPNDPDYSLLWGLNNSGQTGGTVDADIDAPEAWDYLFDYWPDVVVAVIDTGVDYNHPDLVDNMWTNPGEIPNDGIDNDNNGYIDDYRGWDFCNDDNDPFDDHYHGTHCAGTIAAVGYNGIGVIGVNYRAKIMPLKFLSSDGYGYISDAVEAILYAAANGAKVMSNSWGGGGYSTTERDAIVTAYANGYGALFVASAGNSFADNDLTPHYPSSYDLPNVVAVAACDHDDIMAWFSCYGFTSVDLGAPGVEIYSTKPNNEYQYLSGTSMAAPHVSGVAALIMATYPYLTVDEVRNLILNSTDPNVSLENKTVTGGRLNAYKALDTNDNQIRIYVPSPKSTFIFGEETTLIKATVSAGTSFILDANVTVNFNNGEPTIRLYDDGAHEDGAMDDGVYANYWEPTALGSCNITFSASKDGLIDGHKIVTVNIIERIDYGYDDSQPYNWIDATTGISLSLTDDAYVEIPISFDFQFYGMAYSSIKVSSNGYLTFGTDSTDYTNDPIPSTNQPNNIIVPFWDDLNPGKGGNIYYLITGMAPNRALTIEWHQVPHYLDIGAVTFEVTLYESSNDIIFQYQDIYFENDRYDEGRSATVGLEGPGGFYGTQYSYNSASVYNYMAIRFFALRKGTLSGQVLLQGRNDHSNLITFELRNPEETTPIAIYQITTTTDGTYTLDDIPTATYDLTAKTSNSLRAKQTNIIVKTGQVTPNVNFNLLSGDANNDNSVGTGDILILKSAWLSSQGDESWDERADFNGDGSIGTGDMIIMKNNWLVSGDE